MWRFAFGDLDHVIYEPSATADKLTVLLAADPGYEVVLHSFDLGGWPDSDYEIASVDVSQIAGDDEVLYHEDDVTVFGGTDPFHTTFTFAPGLQGQILLITIDSSNLGALSENIGIDNISFSQVLVPEPSAVVMLVIGAMAIMGVLCPRRRRAPKGAA
jgi:hypothetical protein